MAFHRVYLMWVLVCIPACRCLCSKPELIDISPQGFSLGIGHTFKTFPTQSVLITGEILCNGSRSPCSDLQHSSYGQGRLSKDPIGQCLSKTLL
ncbi:uncharacterized protein LOC144623451 isoform X2 [Crassostrea virginica]